MVELRARLADRLGGDHATASPTFTGVPRARSRP